MTALWGRPGPWADLARSQSGIITRPQLHELGWSDADIAVALRGGRFRRVRPGVYAVHTGPLSEEAWGTAMLLGCGDGAALVSASALAAWGALPPGRLLHVGVGTTRRVRVAEGVCLHRRVGLDSEVHPQAEPPRQRVEPATLGWWDELDDVEEGVGAVLRVLGSRTTTPGRLAAELKARSRVRRRLVLSDLLADAASGTQSALEHRYRTAVHRAHGLPAAVFNQPDLLGGGRRYRDVRYELGPVVELDGEAYHAVHGLRRDRRRDNELILAGVPTLRFGWIEVVGDPCGVARDVAALLRLAGWRGDLRPCGACTARAA